MYKGTPDIRYADNFKDIFQRNVSIIGIRSSQLLTTSVSDPRFRIATIQMTLDHFSITFFFNWAYKICFMKFAI